VVLLAASGIYLAIALLPSPSALWGSGYGQLLLAKSALFIVALALALAARRRGLGRWRVGFLRWLTPLEAGVLAGILALSSVLVDLGPPSPGPASATVLGAPPLTGPVARQGGLAGSLTVGLAAGDGQLQVEIYAATSQVAGTRADVLAKLAGQRSPARVALSACGPGCFTAPLQLPEGVSEVSVQTSAPGWPGGSFHTSLGWPPSPEDPGLLTGLQATMRAVPSLRVTEVARSGTRSAGAAHVESSSGAQFVASEPYASGADDVRALPGGPSGFELYLSGDHVWVSIWLDPSGRISKERIINAGNELDRSFDYP
jgi:hypothetical protein